MFGAFALIHFRVVFLFKLFSTTSKFSAVCVSFTITQICSKTSTSPTLYWWTTLCYIMLYYNYIFFHKYFIITATSVSRIFSSARRCLEEHWMEISKLPPAFMTEAGLSWKKKMCSHRYQWYGCDDEDTGCHPEHHNHARYPAVSSACTQRYGSRTCCFEERSDHSELC